MLKYLAYCFLMTINILASSTLNTKDNFFYEDVIFQSNSNINNTIPRHASYFKSNTKNAVILIHQSGYTKESWYFFSKILKDNGLSSLALKNISVDDILGAINFLKINEYENITLMGASLGGASILRVMNTHSNIDISKIILLAPAIGPALQNKVEKLIIVSKNDFYSDKAYETYNEASAPKLLKEYSGTAHAQKLFDTNHKKNLITTILDFLKDNN